MDKVEQPPEKMRCVNIKEKGEWEYTAEKDRPKPKKGEVLIKVERGTIHVSDVNALKGKYEGFTYPMTAGFEGSGTVVESGGGFSGWRAKGKRVCFVGGSYAEYAVVNADHCIPLEDDMSWEQGANMFINPLTAVGIVDRVNFHKAKAVIQTAAASQVGKMLHKMLTKEGVKVVNVVRREEQVTLLKEQENCQYVLNSSSDDYEDKLKELVKELKVSVLIDALAGPTMNQMVPILEMNSVVIMYGFLASEEVESFNAIHLMAKSIRVEPFFLFGWMGTAGIFKIIGAISAAKKLAKDVTVNKTFGLHQIQEALDCYHADMTAGKVFLSPSITE